ncbi:hypothetical protein ZIOFF_033883 [Zingiber officinale]|uniref:1-deoxy-D-xylulose-5-phosphate reductoisomerase n=1 Tax=Zingiber officinale TaxID=94328 RepID=A0A8J5H2W6_ZINOF|nr:hypothetical protein ZIOFF_033883 [Zingiber officinale]
MTNRHNENSTDLFADMCRNNIERCYRKTPDNYHCSHRTPVAEGLNTVTDVVASSKLVRIVKMTLRLPLSGEIGGVSFLESSRGAFTRRKVCLPLRQKQKGATIQFWRTCCSMQQGPPPAWPGQAVAEPGRKSWDGPKPISIVGSTGSIGTQTLDIVAENSDKFKVVALAAGSNVTLLADQIKTFKPQLVSVRNESLVAELKMALEDVEHKPEIIPGEEGIVEVARHPDAVTVVTGIVGCAGLKVANRFSDLIILEMQRIFVGYSIDEHVLALNTHEKKNISFVLQINPFLYDQPTVAAIEAGKDIALANKETLIAGGPFVLPLAHKHNVKILPADSEHSAIFQKSDFLFRLDLVIQNDDFRNYFRFQCIQGLPEDALRRIILTASGGAFRDLPVEKLKDVKVADALKHPNWNMGKKITVDSATLFNKGLEVIEAHYLFGADYDNIEIVIHPQSIIHSMVETQDSSVLAQLGWPDMRLPILYTLSWPDRIYCSETTWPRLDLCKQGLLTFKAPDNVKYPSMDLAYAAGRAGGTMTGVLSAANEKAVEMFINEKINYLDIFKVVELTCDAHRSELITNPSLEEIVHYDLWARDYAANLQLSSGRSPVAA